MCFAPKRYLANRFPSPIMVDVGGNPQASGMMEQSQTYRLSDYDEAPKRNIYALLGAGRGSLRGFSIESLPDF